MICSYHGSDLKPVTINKMVVRSSAVNGGTADYERCGYEELNFPVQGIPFLRYSET